MNYLSAENISRNLGERWVFRNLFFGLQKGEKVALIGKNGTGKTTLMESLMGMQTPDEGKISIRKGIRVGYLPQNPIFAENEQVLNYLFSDDLPSAVAIKSYEKAMLSGDSKELEDAFALMEAHNAWDYEARAKQIISRLGIPDGDQKVSTLSGGQKKRLSLAKLLIESPDIMILDEPTNHLDIETIEWLEGIMSGPNVTVLVVSHDRYFLDKVCNKMMELADGSIYTYEGNYAYFLEKKAEREASEASTVAKAKNLYRKELEWMRRQPKARGTKAQYRIDAFAETEEVAHRKVDDSKLELNIQMSRLGNKIIEINHLKKAWGEKKIVNDFTYTFKKKDRIGIVGKNGAGKSTMLKILARDFAPDSGSIAQEKEIKMGFLRQDIDFEQGRTVLEEAYEAFTEIKIVEKKLEEINHQLVTRTDYESEEYSQIIEDLSDYTHRFELLGGYNYVGDTEKILLGLGFKREVFNNQTETFSGGWRMRIELAKLLLQSNDILLLDEPTNHLDIESIIWLEGFLRNFPGVVVIVSHDKMFLDNVTNRTIEISLGKAYDFNKPYSQYLELRHEIREKQLATQKNQAKKIEETEKLIEKFHVLPEVWALWGLNQLMNIRITFEHIELAPIA